MLVSVLVCVFVHAHTLACGPWALAFLAPGALWLEILPGLVVSSLPLYPFLFNMADAQVGGRRRRAAQAEEGDQVRSVRARMTDAEGRLDTVETTLGRHETRLQFIEAPLRVVLRGFSSVGEFLRVLRENDMRRAKTAFIPSLCDELREKCGPEVQHLVEEAENLLVDRQGWVVIGVYPTGGMMDDKPDGLLRLQPGFAGQRLSHLLVQASRYLADTHQLFQDRVRRPFGEKGADKGKGKGKGQGGKGKGGKGKGKGGRPMPKRAAEPAANNDE